MDASMDTDQTGEESELKVCKKKKKKSLYFDR